MAGEERSGGLGKARRADERSPSPPDLHDPAELLAHDPLAGLGTLVAIVAHEIQNPITYVLGSLQVLRERVEALAPTPEASWKGESEQGSPRLALDREEKPDEAGGESLGDLVDDALEGALRIRGLVRDLLTLSRPGGRSSTPVDVNEVLAATARLVSRRLRPRARLAEELRATRLIQGDPARLGQVFLNLLTNALEACDPPDRTRHRILIRTEDTASGVRVEVHDTGVGIPPEVGAHLFEPFFTTRGSGRGTGLGLYLSRRIAEDHGGSIGYESEAGAGSVFQVNLPEGTEKISDGDRDG
jgi:signal transduction histidine kinase